MTATCASGKLRHATIFAAEEELERARRKRERGLFWRRECRIYMCPDCGGYHLTSKER